MKKVLTIFFLLIPLVLAAQQKALENYFDNLRAGKGSAIPAEIYKTENARTTLISLPVYLKDTMAIIRSKAVQIAHLVGVKSSLPSIRQQAVLEIIIATRDISSGNAGSAFSYLTEFKKTDFLKAHRDSLAVQLLNNPTHIDVLAKLIGYLDIREVKNRLFTMSQQNSLSRRERWAAMLALARMNDTDAIRDIMLRVKGMPVTDAVVYQIFPDLIYTRRSEAIAYLVEALNSDAKNCNAADSEHEFRIPCAYRVMEMLAPIIEGFPLKLDEGGDVIANDYPAALQLARDWFNKNKHYTISTAAF